MTRLIPPVLFLALLLALVPLYLFHPSSLVMRQEMAMPWDVPLALGAAILIWAFLHFKRKNAEIHTFRKPRSLITDGPFRFSRNPMYLATWAGQIGWALAYPMPPILAALAVWAGFYVAAIFLEDRDLLKSHGAEFEIYKAQTARFLGFSHHLEQTEC